jgi:S1-C subfamily serine protease
MASWLLLLLVPGQSIDSETFSRALQQRAAYATVRIANRGERTEGSGVILGRKEKAIYILTAAHFLTRPGRLEVSTFTAESYPRPAKVYENAEVLARTRDIRDLALLRLSADELPASRLPLCPLDGLPMHEAFEALSVGCGAARAPVCMIEKVESARPIRRQPGAQAARFWQTAGEQAPGRSGGPLLDREGRILGIASGVSKGKGYYCHATEIHRWLKAGDFGFLVPQEKKSSEK